MSKEEETAVEPSTQAPSLVGGDEEPAPEATTTPTTLGDAAPTTATTTAPSGTTATTTNDAATTSKNTTTTATTVFIPTKKRLCRFPGCTRVIKSQGHCQRHGARPKRCKIPGCDKQAQGTHQGMCKRHWKEINLPNTPEGGVNAQAPPPPPSGASVYDSILPQSIAFRPTSGTSTSSNNTSSSNKNAATTTTDTDGETIPTTITKKTKGKKSMDETVRVMPLVAFLSAGANKEAGWHRNAERRARGMYPIQSLSAQLEPWEKQLALVEILLLSGGTPMANFKHLAHAWGREKDFHRVLSNNFCERRGEVERKKRSDAGKVLTEEKKHAIKQQRAWNATNNTTSRSSTGGGGGRKRKQQQRASEQTQQQQQQNEEEEPQTKRMRTEEEAPSAVQDGEHNDPSAERQPPDAEEGATGAEEQPPPPQEPNAAMLEERVLAAVEEIKHQLPGMDIGVQEDTTTTAMEMAGITPAEEDEVPADATEVTTDVAATEDATAAVVDASTEMPTNEDSAAAATMPMNTIDQDKGGGGEDVVLANEEGHEDEVKAGIGVTEQQQDFPLAEEDEDEGYSYEV